MRMKLLICAALVVPAAAGAQGLEEAASAAGRNFAVALGGLRLALPKPLSSGAPPAPPAKTPPPAPKAEARTGAPGESADLEDLFVKGAKPEEKDLRGWFAGRRFTNWGPTAALFVGVDVYLDPKQGPIAGKIFKVLLWAPGKPIEGFPETFYDELGSEAANTVISNVREQGPEWSKADFTREKSVVAHKGQAVYELRKSGEWLVARFPNGDYGYFFKKVRKE